LARDSARQELLALAEAREVAHYALGRAIAAPGPARPALLPASPDPSDPAARAIAGGAPAWIARGLRQRSDLAAFDQRLQALERERGAVRAERWPRLDAGARWSWTSGSPFAEQDQLEGTLGVTWTPFAAGTRAPRAAALAEGESALRAQSLELRRQVELEVRAALARFATARGAVALAETAGELAAETLRVEAERFSAGRSTANDLLAAEAELRDQRAAGELARIELLRARLELALAIDEPELALAGAASATIAPADATLEDLLKND
jgi:outer membrane protein TolC